LHHALLALAVTNEQIKFSNHYPTNCIESDCKMSVYRVLRSITAVLHRGTSERFKIIDGGSVLVSVSPPNAAGMLEVRFGDEFVMVFKRDLDDASERIETDSSCSSRA
jgi:hypothetical protein